MDTTTLADLRRDYSLRELSETGVDHDPFTQFAAWFDEALESQVLEPNAMTMSTVDADGRPSSRVVLLKGFGADGFVFFTNYGSKKAADLAQNANITLHFFWPDLERQVNIRGQAAKTSREESEAYFASRPFESRIGAWASEQSSVIASRAELEKRFGEMRSQYQGVDVPCPPFWGGFCVVPERFEFWQGRASRLHDRICYDLVNCTWMIARLSP